MKLTPISSPRLAPVLGANTVTAQAAREAAMAKFNEAPADVAAAQNTGPLTTGQSPSQPGAILDPASLTQTPTYDGATQTAASTEATTPQTPSTVDQEAARIASHYANLARKEKMIRIREMRLQQGERSRQPQITTTATQQPQFDPSKYVAKDELIGNPFGVLNNLGLTYEQLTQKALDAPSHEDLEQRRQISALQTKIEALEASQTKVEKTFEENQTMARRQAELQIRQDVNRLIAQDPSFEVTRANNASHDIVKLITSTYDHGMGINYPRGTILDIQEAALMVENELTDRVMRTLKLNKIQQRLNSNRAANEKPQTNQQPQESTLRTLTNAIGTSSRKLTNRDRALAAFRGESV